MNSHGLEALLTRRVVAQLTLAGMGLDVLGGCYLAYDLLGGKQGPLRTVSRAAGYTAVLLAGYVVVLGWRYAIVAAAGLGLLLALEFRFASTETGEGYRRVFALLFAFLRGAVLGLASLALASARFAFWFGLLCGAGLSVIYQLGFAPLNDYESGQQPHITGHKILASLLRAVTAGVAAVMADLIVRSPAAESTLFALRVGFAAGSLSALVSFLGPVIEWRAETLPDRFLGVFGLILILLGVALQSIQYWLVAFA